MTSATTTTARGDATRQALLDAATERFARDGFRTTSVADISRDAGVGGTTAYVHFENKEALFLAAVDRDLTSLFEQVIAALAEVPDESWDRLFTGLVALVQAHPLAGRLLAGLEPTITARVLSSPAFDELRHTIAVALEDAQAAGRVRPDLSPGNLADGLVAVVVAVTMATVQIGDEVLDTFGPGLAAVFRGVLTPDPRLGG